MDRLQELARKLHNLIRYATVQEVEAHTCRVEVGGLLSARLPWLTQRAGSDRTWWAPSVGEQVLLLSPSGDPAQGIVLPGLYQDAHPAPVTNPAQHTTHYRDGAIITYDTEQHQLSATVPGDAVLKLTGNLDAQVGRQASLTAKSIIGAAPTIQLNGAVTVTGSLTVAGPVSFGPGKGGGGAQIKGDVAIQGGLTNNGKNVSSTHVHISSRDGDPSSPPR